MAAVVFDEAERRQIEPQLADGVIFVPALFEIEMASVCLKKIRLHPEEREKLLAAFEKFLLLPIVESGIDLSETISLAMDERLSLYDASYLWLARHLGMKLVTLDSTLAKAAKRIAI